MPGEKRETLSLMLDCRICQDKAPVEERFPLAWPMFRCGRCGTVQTEVLPTPQELSLFYGARYLDRYTAGMSERKFAREMPLRFRAKLGLIRRFAPGARSLLDVGCGEGMFLAMARQEGYQATGVDYGLRSTGYPAGVEVRSGVLDEPGGLPVDHESLDLVTSWAVIEHLRAPQAALAETRRVLKPGGVFFCETPLCGDLSERWVAAFSHWYNPPEHLHVFSARGLRTLVQSAGFEVLAHWPSFERSLGRAVLRRARNHLVGTLGGGLLRLFAPRAWRRRRTGVETPIGDIQVLVARKPLDPSRSL